MITPYCSRAACTRPSAPCPNRRPKFTAFARLRCWLRSSLVRASHSSRRRSSIFMAVRSCEAILEDLNHGPVIRDHSGCTHLHRGPVADDKDVAGPSAEQRTEADHVGDALLVRDILQVRMVTGGTP